MPEIFLKILSGPREGLNVPLGTSALVIGRRKGDIIINDPLISTTHAKIYPTSEGWYIEDLQSMNGTLVNGVLTQRARLYPGVEISVGNSTMVLFVELAEHDEHKPLVSHKIRNKAEISWLLDEELRDLAYPKHAHIELLPNELRLPPGIKAEIEVVNGQDVGTIFKVSTGSMTIGRKYGEIPLSDVEVSRKHASLDFFSKDMIFLQDLGSTNGTFHNGRRVSNSKLQNGSTIGLGRSLLRLRLR